MVYGVLSIATTAVVVATIVHTLSKSRYGNVDVYNEISVSKVKKEGSASDSEPIFVTTEHFHDNKLTPCSGDKHQIYSYGISHTIMWLCQNYG